jgi:hypothetical protein
MNNIGAENSVIPGGVYNRIFSANSFAMGINTNISQN